MEPAIIISIVTTAAAVVSVVFGVITHLKNQTLKRQEIIMPLMKEFDSDKRLKIALNILDGFVIDPEGPYSKLSTTLRIEKVNDPAEIKVRDSFSSLLGFFGKLGYLMQIGVISNTDLGYFEYYINTSSEYYIDTSKRTSAISTYAEKYEFELYAILLDKIHRIPTEGLKTVAKKNYQRNKKSIFRRILQSLRVQN